MKNKGNKYFWLAVGSFAAFAVWTFLVRFVDVQPIGPLASIVGFATVNGWFHNITGVHIELYTLTDWLSMIPLGIVLWFALLGLIQWIQRRSLGRGDPDILLLGASYASVLLAYVLFEKIAVNYRPVLLDGYLEPSYPSSTTMLVLCVMPTAVIQGKMRIRHQKWKMVFVWAMNIYSAAMVAGRLISGVHWLTDIIGGILLSCGVVLLYSALCIRYRRMK